MNLPELFFLITGRKMYNDFSEMNLENRFLLFFFKLNKNVAVTHLTFKVLYI